MSHAPKFPVKFSCQGILQKGCQTEIQDEEGELKPRALEQINIRAMTTLDKLCYQFDVLQKTGSA